MEYYISVNNDKRGPYSTEELRARGITSETLVMSENSNQWTPAWQIEELRPIIKASQPSGDAQPKDGEPITDGQKATQPDDLHVEAIPLDDPFDKRYSGPQGQAQGQQTAQQAQPAGAQAAGAYSQNYQQGRPVEPPQPPTKQKSGGGCGKSILIFLIIVAVLAGLAVVTCPDEADHKNALTTVVSSAISDEANGSDSTFQDDDVVGKMFRQVSDSWTKEVVAAAVNNLIHVDNHILFSTGKVRLAGKEHTVSVGVFGHVFTVDKDDLRKAAESYYSKAEKQVKDNLQKKAEQMFNENVVAPAAQAIKDIAKQVGDEVRKQLGDAPWPFDEGSDDEPADSSSASGGF